MTLVTTRLFNTHSTAKSAGVMPRFAACLQIFPTAAKVSFRMSRFNTLPSPRATRLPFGGAFLGSCFPVSTPRASGEKGTTPILKYSQAGR